VKPATRLVRGGPAADDPHRATAPPLYQTATFAQTRALEFDAYDYSRTDNPTRRQLEVELARLEGGAGALAYASGMAAVAAALRQVRPGRRLLVGQDLYGGTERFLGALLDPSVCVGRVDTTDLAAVERALARGADMLYLESPSNPLMEVCDLAALASLTRRAATLLAVDNTMLSPWLQRPLELGADLVIQSCTKHLGGHGDLTAGALIVAREDQLAPLAFARNGEGTALAPFEAWLLLRGMKTLGVRVERAQASARRIAAALRAHPAVTRVRYPEQGSVLAFETGDADRSRAVVEGTDLLSIAVSFGGVSSSIGLPCAMSHASVPAARRAAAPLPADLVRVAVGLEDPEDLIADLQKALRSPVTAPAP
jgi:cysteine-S-conjugate beta-lyase